MVIKPQLYADTVLTVNLEAVVGNYRLLKAQSNQAECAAVVKANAYGLGVIPVAKALADAGCKHFFVANLDEAIELREIIKDLPIYILHGLRPGQEAILQQYKFIPVLNDLWQIECWQKAAKVSGKKLPAILHVDTGMTRLGVSSTLIEKALPLLEGIELQYLMSHLSCADMPSAPHSHEQLEKFKQIKKTYFSHILCSFANSSGIYLGNDYHFDLLRPGCALYGVSPIPEKNNPMAQVVTLTSHILQLRTLDHASDVGYGATYHAPNGAVIATIPVGYADGYLRELSGKASIMIDGKIIPIVGRVSMDMITVDVSSIPKETLYPGKAVELIGKHITIDDLAHHANTIGYEILTSLGNRYRREYKGS